MVPQTKLSSLSLNGSSFGGTSTQSTPYQQLIDGFFDLPSSDKIERPAQDQSAHAGDFSEIEYRLDAFLAKENVRGVMLSTYLKTLGVYEETIKYRKSLAPLT